MKQIRTGTVLEVHVAGPHLPPGVPGIRPILPGSVCVHIEQRVESPVRPHVEGPAGEIAKSAMMAYQQMGMMPANMNETVLTELVLQLTSEEYRNLGKPVPGDKVNITVELVGDHAE